MLPKYLPSVFAYAQFHIKFQTRASLHAASLDLRQKICVQFLSDPVDFPGIAQSIAINWKRRNSKVIKTKRPLVLMCSSEEEKKKGK